MDVLDFPKETKPREIFAYTCERMAEPLIPLGFKYRKSKNDIVKTDRRFQYAIWFQPSIKFGSANFSVHVLVTSDELAAWRKRNGVENATDVVLGETLAALTHRAQEWPQYCVQTLAERERVIAEVTQQIHEFALPFFDRFQNLDDLVKDVRARGFLPHRKLGNRLHRKKDDEFCQCFAGDPA